LLPHGVILARKKRKKIKNVGKKTSNIYARFWLPIIKKTQFNEKWVKKNYEKKISNTNLDCNKQFPLSKESLPWWEKNKKWNHIYELSWLSSFEPGYWPRVVLSLPQTYPCQPWIDHLFIGCSLAQTLISYT